MAAARDPQRLSELAKADHATGAEQRRRQNAPLLPMGQRDGDPAMAHCYRAEQAELSRHDRHPHRRCYLTATRLLQPCRTLNAAIQPGEPGRGLKLSSNILPRR